MKFVDITNNLRMKQIVTLALLVLCSVTFYFNDLRANRNYVVDIFEKYVCFIKNFITVIKMFLFS